MLEAWHSLQFAATKNKTKKINKRKYSMITFDVNEKMQEQLFKDKNNGFSSAEVKAAAAASEDNPLQAKYDEYINMHKDDINWFGKPKQFYCRFANYAFWLVCAFAALVLSCLYSPVILVFFIPIGIIAGIAVSNYDFPIGKCTSGCSKIYSEIIGDEFNPGSGTKIIRCKKCGKLRYVSWYIGFD